MAASTHCDISGTMLRMLLPTKCQPIGTGPDSPLQKCARSEPWCLPRNGSVNDTLITLAVALQPWRHDILW